MNRRTLDELLDRKGLRLETFVPEHAERMELTPFSASELAGEDCPGAFGRKVTAHGHGWTLLTAEDAVVGCAGVVSLWPGVGEAWALTTALVMVYPLEFTRAVRAGVRLFFSHGCHRIQMHVRADNEAAVRWAARHLGFCREGLCRAYDQDGRDYYRYARIAT